jgi:hypothetical protein
MPLPKRHPAQPFVCDRPFKVNPFQTPWLTLATITEPERLRIRPQAAPRSAAERRLCLRSLAVVEGAR